jgi:hypothetical protein
MTPALKEMAPIGDLTELKCYFMRFNPVDAVQKAPKRSEQFRAPFD